MAASPFTTVEDVFKTHDWNSVHKKNKALQWSWRKWWLTCCRSCARLLLSSGIVRKRKWRWATGDDRVTIDSQVRESSVSFFFCVSHCTPTLQTGNKAFYKERHWSVRETRRRNTMKQSRSCSPEHASDIPQWSVQCETHDKSIRLREQCALISRSRTAYLQTATFNVVMGNYQPLKLYPCNKFSFETRWRMKNSRGDEPND